MVLKKKVILVCIDWFEPAYKAGGPIRTVSNMIHMLQKDFDIYVLTSDRDLGDKDSMAGIKLNAWSDFNSGIKIFYAQPQKQTWTFLQNTINEIHPDFIYCSGIYSWYFNISPIILKRFRKLKGILLLSPHGMLKGSALTQKKFKKRVYLTLFKFLKLDSVIRFHATDEGEANDIKREFGNVKIKSIMDCPEPIGNDVRFIEKKRGELRIIFIGRIHPVKNLKYLLNALKSVQASITLNIIGVIEDILYWSSCKQIIQTLPDCIQVNMLGEVEHKHIRDLIDQNHILALPTQGENFGHAIYESLAVGRPVLISDQTPWRNLETNQSGWDISLDNPDKFIKVITDAAMWEQDTFDTWSYSAKKHLEKVINLDSIYSSYKKLFS